MDLKITILAENYADSVPIAEDGFSALIELNGKKFLFDTGLTGECVIANARTKKINLTEIESIIISHGHDDHAQGLESILKLTGGKTIHAHPEIFGKKYSRNNIFSGISYNQEYVEDVLGATFNFQTGFHKIYDNLYMTGEVPITNDFEKIPKWFVLVDKQSEGKITPDPFNDDNSVIIDTDKGLIVICGCAHRGIINIMSYAKKMLGKNIRAIIGGTHLKEAKKDQFMFTVNQLKNETPELIAPGHCTGIEKIFELKSLFPENVVPAFCGSKFIFQ